MNGVRQAAENGSGEGLSVVAAHTSLPQVLLELHFLEGMRLLLLNPLFSRGKRGLLCEKFLMPTGNRSYNADEHPPKSRRTHLPTFR